MTPACFNRLLMAAVSAFAGIGPAGAQPAPTPLRASISLATDYVHNGLLQTVEGPAMRLAFDYEHPTGFFAGATLANVEYRAESQFRTPRDTQLTAYAGYLWRRKQWMTNVTVSRYVYPDIERDYDYSQAAVSVSYRDRYFLTVSQSTDYLEFYDRARQVRAGLALPWIWNLEFGVNAGRMKYGGAFGASYTHWDIGLSRPAGRFAIDLRFHDSTFDRLSLAGNRTKNQWVLSMTYSLLPLRRSRDRR